MNKSHQSPVYNPNFLQSKEWGEVNTIIGHHVVWVNGVLAIIKNARRGRYLEVPGCPKIKDFAKLTTLAREQHCAFIRLRFQLPNSAENQAYALKHGLKKAPMHLHAEHTVIIDLSHTEEELLGNMRRQTRYEVRRSEKQGITITRSHDEATFREFHRVQSATAARQHFVPPDLKTLLAEHQAFGKDAVIYTASTKDGQPIAYGLIIKSGEEAEYFEAASTDLGRKYPGAYALLWQAIRDLKAEGYQRFNLWGIAPAGQPHHRYAGVTTFKTGFGGDIIEYLPAMDLIISRPKYLINLIIEKIRKKVRNL